MSPLFLFRIWTVSLLVALPFTIWMEWVDGEPPAGNLSFAILSSLSSLCVVFLLLLEKRIRSQERYSYEKRIRALETEYDRQRNRNHRFADRAGDSIKEKNKRIEGLTKQLNKLRDTLTDLEHENENRQSEIESLNRKLREKKEEMDRLEDHFDRWKKNLFKETDKEKRYWRGKAGAEKHWKERYKKEKECFFHYMGKYRSLAEGRGRDRSRLRDLIGRVKKEVDDIGTPPTDENYSQYVKKKVVALRQRLMSGNYMSNMK